jgi:hypothetical protein
MRLGDGVFVRVKDNFSLFIVDMQATEEKNYARKRSVARNRLEPVI